MSEEPVRTRPWFDLRLTTDIPAFLQELATFTAEYVSQKREPRLISSFIGEWRQGQRDMQALDRVAAPADPAQVRRISIRLEYQSEIKEWLSIPADLDLVLQRQTDDLTLLTIPPGQVDMLPFARALVAHCKRRLDAVSVAEPITADDAITIYYRRRKRNSKTTLRQVCQEFGMSEGYVRKRKVAYDRKHREESITG